MTISAQRIIVRFGMSQQIPALDVGELGWDIDLHRLRVGDASSAPTIVMTNKSLGSYEFNFIDYVQFPEIRMLPEGTVDGVDISDLNAANGFVVRRGNNLWAHRTLTNTDTFITIANPAGTAGNPVLNLSAEFVDLVEDALHFVTVDDVTIHGNGRPEAPLYAHTANTTEKGVVELATNAETQQGVDATRAITSAGLSSRTATETRTGIAAIASQTETNTGSTDDKIVTPEKLHNRVSTFTRTGIIRKATLPEVMARVDTDSVVVPAYLHEYVAWYVENFGGKGGGWVSAGTIPTPHEDTIIDMRPYRGVAISGMGRFGNYSVEPGQTSEGTHQDTPAITIGFRGNNGIWYYAGMVNVGDYGSVSSPFLYGISPYRVLWSNDDIPYERRGIQFRPSLGELVWVNALSP